MTKPVAEAKAKTVTLVWWAVPGVYEVKAVTNSIDFNPGDHIKPKQVKKLVDDPSWTVNSGSVDILKFLPIFGG
jgi:hypothetical protein